MALDASEQGPGGGMLPAGTQVKDQVVQAWVRAVPEGHLYRVVHALSRETALLQEFYPPDWARREGDRVVAQPHRTMDYQVGLKRFLLRVRQLSRLSHPALPTLLDAWPGQGTAYALLAEPAGRSLAEVVQSAGGNLPTERFWSWLNACMDFAEWLHAQGKVHGAWDPTGIWVMDDGRLVLPPPDVEGGAQPGSPWQALEQTALAPIGTQRGPWTDVFGIAALAAFMLTGQGPMAAARRGVGQRWSAPTKLGERDAPAVDQVPPALMAAIRVSLLPNPRQRPQGIPQLKAMMGLNAPPGTDEAAATVPAGLAPAPPGHAERAGPDTVPDTVALEEYADDPAPKPEAAQVPPAAAHAVAPPADAAGTTPPVRPAAVPPVTAVKSVPASAADRVPPAVAKAEPMLESARKVAPKKPRRTRAKGEVRADSLPPSGWDSRPSRIGGDSRPPPPVPMSGLAASGVTRGALVPVSAAGLPVPLGSDSLPPSQPPDPRAAGRQQSVRAAAVAAFAAAALAAVLFVMEPPRPTEVAVARGPSTSTPQPITPAERTLQTQPPGAGPGPTAPAPSTTPGTTAEAPTPQATAPRTAPAEVEPSTAVAATPAAGRPQAGAMPGNAATPGPVAGGTAVVATAATGTPAVAGAVPPAEPLASARTAARGDTRAETRSAARDAAVAATASGLAGAARAAPGSPRLSRCSQALLEHSLGTDAAAAGVAQHCR